MSLKKIKLNKKKLDDKSDETEIKSTNSTHLIEDDSDNDSDSGDSVSWSENESQNNEEYSEEELDEDDEIVDMNKITKKITEEEIEEFEDDEVNEVKFEITKDEQNNKCVKVSVALDLETSNDIINIEFLISKETFLKLANQLK
jgi:hypothetical protein